MFAVQLIVFMAFLKNNTLRFILTRSLRAMKIQTLYSCKACVENVHTVIGI
jgi:hypothetical protein